MYQNKSFLIFSIFVATLSIIACEQKVNSIQIDSKSHALPQTLFEDTNPRVEDKTQRVIASESVVEDNEEKDKNKKSNKHDESYSLSDPNLYESGFSQSSGLKDISEINSRLNDQEP